MDVWNIGFGTEPVLVKKVKESYRNKGKKEQQTKDLGALEQAISEAKEKHRATRDLYPDDGARRGKAFRDALWKIGTQQFSAPEYDLQATRRRIGGTDAEARVRI